MCPDKKKMTKSNMFCNKRTNTKFVCSIDCWGLTPEQQHFTYIQTRKFGCKDILMELFIKGFFLLDGLSLESINFLITCRLTRFVTMVTIFPMKMTDSDFIIRITVLKISKFEVILMKLCIQGFIGMAFHLCTSFF